MGPSLKNDRILLDIFLDLSKCDCPGLESDSEYTWCQLLLIGMPCSGPSPAAGLTGMETSWTFTLVDAMRSRRVGPAGIEPATNRL